MTLPYLKYCFAAVAICTGAAIPVVHHVPAAIGIASVLIGVIVAAVVCERERGALLSDPLSSELDAPDVWTKREPIATRVLIVGAGTVGRTLAECLEADGRHQVVGFVDDTVEMSASGKWQVLGGRNATTAIVQRYRVDEVIVAYAPTWQQLLVEELARKSPEVSVRVAPTSYEAMMQLSSVESVGDIALVRLADGAGAREALKRAFDVGASACGLIVLAPLMLVVSAVIKLTSTGPVIFAQERVGRYGRPFTLFKFRTMVHDAEANTGPVLSTGKHDDRLTPVGRWLKLFRIDEIPQLWNVVRGDMSMVGPRPERQYFVEKFQQLVPTYERRHQVRPGITGLAQVCGGYHTDARDKLRFDLIYVSHQSFWLDLLILVRTLLVVSRPSR